MGIINLNDGRVFLLISLEEVIDVGEHLEKLHSNLEEKVALSRKIRSVNQGNFYE